MVADSLLMSTASLAVEMLLALLAPLASPLVFVGDMVYDRWNAQKGGRGVGRRVFLLSQGGVNRRGASWWREDRCKWLRECRRARLYDQTGGRGGDEVRSSRRKAKLPQKNTGGKGKGRWCLRLGCCRSKEGASQLDVTAAFLPAGQVLGCDCSEWNSLPRAPTRAAHRQSQPHRSSTARGPDRRMQPISPQLANHGSHIRDGQLVLATGNGWQAQASIICLFVSM